MLAAPRAAVVLVPTNRNEGWPQVRQVRSGMGRDGGRRLTVAMTLPVLPFRQGVTGTAPWASTGWRCSLDRKLLNGLDRSALCATLLRHPGRSVAPVAPTEPQAATRSGSPPWSVGAQALAGAPAKTSLAAGIVIACRFSCH